MSTVEDRLNAAGWELPALRDPIGVYHGWVQVGDLVFLSGHGPILDGERVLLGKLGGNLSIEQGREAARIVIVNALRTLKEAIGDLDATQRIVKLLGFVNSAPGFEDQPKVIDAASELLVHAFGDRGYHARSAIGVAELPFGISVEIEMIVQVSGP
jgi:enamine deaminase RidA (YjgF/YER057c/UK114 family)